MLNGWDAIPGVLRGSAVLLVVGLAIWAERSRAKRLYTPKDLTDYARIETLINAAVAPLRAEIDSLRTSINDLSLAHAKTRRTTDAVYKAMISRQRRGTMRQLIKHFDPKGSGPTEIRPDLFWKYWPSFLSEEYGLDKDSERLGERALKSAGIDPSVAAIDATEKRRRYAIEAESIRRHLENVAEDVKKHCWLAEIHP